MTRLFYSIASWRTVDDLINILLLNLLSLPQYTYMMYVTSRYAQCLLCADVVGGWSLRRRTRENGAHVSYTLLLAHILFNYLYII